MSMNDARSGHNAVVGGKRDSRAVQLEREQLDITAFPGTRMGAVRNGDIIVRERGEGG
jgi:predicted dinucleotide-binding enzyme